MGMVERCRGLFDSDEGQTRMHRISVADCVFPGMDTTGLCKNAVLINRNGRLLDFFLEICIYYVELHHALWLGNLFAFFPRIFTFHQSWISVAVEGGAYVDNMALEAFG